MLLARSDFLIVEGEVRRRDMVRYGYTCIYMNGVMREFHVGSCGFLRIEISEG